MFKIWHIFVLSLTPVALLFLGVIGGSIYGHGGSSAELSPVTAPALPATSSARASDSDGDGGGMLQIAAKNLVFDKRTLSAAPNASLTIRFNNQDAGVPHNVAFYTTNRATSKIFVGDLVIGPTSTTYTFTAPSAPGNYYFRCDAHPDQMTGTFTVK